MTEMETWTDIERGVDDYFKECERLRREKERYFEERYFEEMELEEVD